MIATPEALAETLVESVRGHGLEAGIRASLEAVFVRWLALRDGETEKTPFRPDRWQDASLLRAQDSVEVRTLQRLDGRNLEMLFSSLYNIPAQVEDARKYLRTVFEALLLLRETRLGRAAGESASRSDIARAMAGLVGMGPRLLDPACGVGNSLMAASESGRQSVVGYEINSETASIARMRFLIAELTADIREADWLLSNNYELGEWDAVCLEPPFSVRLTEEQSENNRSIADVAGHQGDLVWLRRAVESLSPRGYAAVLLPISSLTSAKTEKARLRLVMEGAVEAVISLPAGAALGTSVETCLWVLRGPGRGTARDPVLLGRVSNLRSGGSDELRDVVSAVLGWRATSEFGQVEPWMMTAIAREVVGHERTLLPQKFLPEVPVQIEERPHAPARHLSELRLRNFKGIGSAQRSPLRPLTLIYGQNSAGKSSLIQALMLLRQSLPTTSLAVTGPAVDLGSFRGMVHRHELERQVSIGISYGTSADIGPDDYVPTPALLRSVDAAFAEDPRGAASSRSVRISLGNETASFSREEGTEHYVIAVPDIVRLVDASSHPEFWYPRGRVANYRVETSRRVARLLQRKGIEAVRVPARSLLPNGQIDSDLRSDNATRPNLEASYVQRALDAVGVVSAEVNSLFSRMAYLGPLREAPKRFASRGAPHDAAIDLAYFLLDNASERERVSAWMARLGLSYELDVVSLAAVPEAHVFGDLVSIALRDPRSDAVLSPADVGFGVSQVLPILVELSARTESVVLIEQPEIHLHPAMQAELADVLIESIDDAGRRNQVIAETHSEHIMLRVQRRIREGQLAADDVAVLYVDQNQQGTASVQRLRLRDDGEFVDPWPHGFFAERFDEIFSDLL